MSESSRAEPQTQRRGTVRPAAVAGIFYPEEREDLATRVAGLLASAPHFELPGRVRAIIVPHAGYLYSGAVAASAFAALGQALGPLPPRRVVVIGPSHHVSFTGIAVPHSSAFATPLGEMAIDGAAIESIATLPQVTITDAPHAPEHALEVELPFLQTVVGPLPIVPLLVGRASADQVAEVLGRLWDDETLVVVSSDLSHYLDREAARARDAATAAAIERLDGSRIGPHDACGALPLTGLLLEAKRRRLAIHRLDLRNSGDTGGDRRRVVGYGAWVLCSRATGR